VTDCGLAPHFDEDEPDEAMHSSLISTSHPQRMFLYAKGRYLLSILEKPCMDSLELLLY
jgi:hypothetical protein